MALPALNFLNIYRNIIKKTNLQQVKFIYSKPLSTYIYSKCFIKISKNIKLPSHKLIYNEIIVTHLNNYSIRNCSTKETLKCWSCGSSVIDANNFCAQCNKLQVLKEDSNYFEIVGINKEFSLDVKELKKRFRLLQGLYHPDRFSNKSEREQELSGSHSSAVNKAYRTLLHPVARAEYLLVLAGVPLEEGEITMEPGFLAEVMELNEELADAVDAAAVTAIGMKNKNTLDGLLRSADVAFRSGELNKAREAVARVKYYESLCTRVIEYEREHGVVD